MIFFLQPRITIKYSIHIFFVVFCFNSHIICGYRSPLNKGIESFKDSWYGEAIEFTNFSLQCDFNSIIDTIDIETSIMFMDSISLQAKEFLTKKRTTLYNEHVEIKDCRLWDIALSFANYHEPFIKGLLQQEDLPVELSYFPLFMSGFNPHYRDDWDRVGIWQLDYITAKRYGLVITQYIDERKDSFLSTKAAISYLKDLHIIYDDWYLVLLAYSCGFLNLQKSITKASSNAYDLLDPYLPELYRDIPLKYLLLYRTIASNRISSNLDQLLGNNRYKVISKHSIDLDMKVISRHLNMPIEQLVDYNFLHRSTIINSKDSFYVPSKYLSLWKEHEQSIYRAQDSIHQKKKSEFLSRKNSINFIYYKVRRGDNLSSIARRFSVYVRDIKRWNYLKNDRIIIGQRIKIYTTKKNKSSSDSYSKKETVKNGENYIL